MSEGGGKKWLGSIVVALIVGLFIGAAAGYAAKPVPEPEVITETVERTVTQEVPKEVVKEVEVMKEVPVEVTKTVTVSPSPKEDLAAKLEKAQLQIEGLQLELTKQRQDYIALQKSHNDLLADYNDLKAKYQALTQPAEGEVQLINLFAETGLMAKLKGTVINTSTKPIAWVKIIVFHYNPDGTLKTRQTPLTPWTINNLAPNEENDFEIFFGESPSRGDIVKILYYWDGGQIGMITLTV